MENDAVAERLGAQRILADRLQHPAERRVDDAQQRQKQREADEEDEIVADQSAIERDAEERPAEQSEARLQNLGDPERAAVLAAGQPVELRSEHAERIADRQRHHGEEDRLHAQRQQADRQRQHGRDAERRGEAERRRAPTRPKPVKRQPDAIGADAEEHHMGKGDHAGVAEQQIVGRAEQGVDADLGGDVERLGAGEEQRRQRQRERDDDDQRLQRPPARRRTGEDHHRPPTG